MKPNTEGSLNTENNCTFQTHNTRQHQ